MKITNVRTICLKYNYKKPIMYALGTTKSRQCVIVLIDTDEKITGIGEAAYFGGPTISTKTIIEKELKPELMGEDPFKVERIWKKLFSTSYYHGRRGLVLTCIGAIDIALWDIIGKYCHLPVYKLCGGYRDKILAYASGGIYQEGKGIQELVKEVQGYVEKGFKAVKMKVGRNKNLPLSPLEVITDNQGTISLEEDLERVRAVRKAIGKDIYLMVDANSSWTPSIAIQMGREFEKLGIYWLEEPVQTDDIRGSKQVAEALDLQIAGYESEQGLFGYRELIVRQAVDIVQPDPTWVGGFSEAKKIAHLAQAYGMLCIPHSWNSGVSVKINSHFIASISNSQMIELDRNFNPLRDELLLDPIEIDKEGYYHLSEKPGFGIEFNENILKKYTVED